MAGIWNGERSSSSTTRPTSPTSSGCTWNERGSGCCRRPRAPRALEAFPTTGPGSSSSTSGLPDIDGLEVCKRIRRRRRSRSSSSPPATARSTGCSGSSWAPTTTSRSRSRRPSWWRASRRCCAVRRLPAARGRAGAGGSTIDVGRREIAGRRHRSSSRPRSSTSCASSPSAPGSRSCRAADPGRRLGLRLVRRPAHRRRAHRAGAQEGRRRRARSGRSAASATGSNPDGAARTVRRPPSRLRNRLLVAMVRRLVRRARAEPRLAAAALARQSSANAATKRAGEAGAGRRRRARLVRQAVPQRIADPPDGERSGRPQIRRLVARVLAISHSSVVTVSPTARSSRARRDCSASPRTRPRRRPRRARRSPTASARATSTRRSSWRASSRVGPGRRHRVRRAAAGPDRGQHPRGRAQPEGRHAAPRPGGRVPHRHRGPRARGRRDRVRLPGAAHDPAPRRHAGDGRTDRRG